MLREIDLHLHDGLDAVVACRKTELSDKSFSHRRNKFGDFYRVQVSEIKLLKNENEQFKKFVASLQFDKLILKESLYHLKPST